MASTGDITVELMQGILREVEKDNTIVVLPCLEVHELNEDLHGGSCLSRVTVTYTHGDTSQNTLSLIVKVVPNNGSIADAIQKSSAFPREIQMFDEILPRMSTLLARALPGRHPDFSARVYYTRKTPSYLIAIEDLSPKGFKASKRKGGLDLKHCLLAFRAIARFHATSKIIRREDESLFAVFDNYFFQEQGVYKVMDKIIRNIIPIICKEIESWPEFGRSWADRVRLRYQTIYDELKQVWKRDDSGFNVLNHCDFGVHNVMYLYSEPTKEVESIILVDFQCCSYNSPVLDLIQFIFSSASNEVRENHIDTLLREYHAELTATLEALGVQKEQTISLMQLHSDFDSKTLYGFHYMACFLPFLSFDKDKNPDFNIDAINNIGNDGSDILQSVMTDSYFTHLRRMLPIFNQKKIFN